MAGGHSKMDETIHFFYFFVAHELFRIEAFDLTCKLYRK
jgi:hypothetical protein